MGREKYLTDIAALFKKSPVVSASSISRLIRSKKRVKQYQKQLVRNLLLQGRIKKLVNGNYTTHDDPSLAVFCFKPAYLGLQDAMSYHEVWEQETIPVIITASKARQGMRKVLGMNVLIRRIDRKYLFGYEYVKQGDFYLPYSDMEKTLIDMAYFRQKFSEETMKNIKEKIDKKKLKSYLNVYPKIFREIVLRKLDE
ncbi:MAG TPA: hypothetical protein VJC16_00610 [Candidatus Nanoarchaeia archaeon]|nr:hypothetical protein [Candidatus Nanoarchaeia archaeon]